jgi:hypothetical protein
VGDVEVILFHREHFMWEGGGTRDEQCRTQVYRFKTWLWPLDDTYNFTTSFVRFSFRWATFSFSVFNTILFIKNYLLDGTLLPDKSTLTNKRETILNTNNKVSKDVYKCPSHIDTPWLTAGSPEAKSSTHQGSLCLMAQNGCGHEMGSWQESARHLTL